MQTAKKTLTLKRSDNVYRDLLQQIRQGKLMPGERLPTEDDLMKHYNIGRSSVRNSLSRLREAGFLVRRQGSGTYITDSAGIHHTGNTEVVCMRTTYTEWEGFWANP